MFTDLWLKLLRSQEMMHSLYVENPESQVVHEEPHFSLLIRSIYCLLQCVPGSLEDPKTVTHHKLIHATSEKVLTDTKTVLEENIQDRGEFVWV